MPRQVHFDFLQCNQRVAFVVKVHDEKMLNPTFAPFADEKIEEE